VVIVASGVLCRSARKLSTPLSKEDGGTELTSLASGTIVGGTENFWGTYDTTSATAMSTSWSIPTERAVYYGLPKFNDSKSYSSNTNLYAPTSTGDGFLRSNGSGAPSYLIVGDSEKSFTMESGFSNDGTNFYRWGCFVFVNFAIISNTSVSANSWKKIISLPSEITNRFDSCTLFTTYGGAGVGRLSVNGNSVYIMPHFSMSSGTGFVAEIYYPAKA
jgi:hypothetical protein